VERLQALCDVVTAFNASNSTYSVPILFHWDLGATDTGTVEDNWIDLLNLLDHVAEGGFLTHIILDGK